MKLLLLNALLVSVSSFYNAFFTKCYGNNRIQFPLWELEIALQFSETSKLFYLHKIKPQRFEDEREYMRLECSSEKLGLQENMTLDGGLFKGTSISVAVTSTRLFSFLSVCLCLSASLTLSFWSEILSWSKENFLNESFIWTSVKSYNFNTLAFLAELTSSTYDYIYIKSSIPCSKELSNHIVVSYDFILLYFDVLLLNKLELISDVLLNKTQTWNLTHLWETGYG